MSRQLRRKMQLPFANVQASKSLNGAQPDRTGGGGMNTVITAVRVVPQVDGDTITPEGIRPVGVTAACEHNAVNGFTQG